jgi:1,4-dihydroxy-2-naphthoate octaprenyltransferase
VTLVIAGAGAAWYVGDLSWSRTLVALIGLVLLHMAVNILNEWSDLRTGIDLATTRTPFSGGSGTLPAGGMSARTALGLGLVCAGLGLMSGLWFLWQLGLVIVPILALGAICVLGYTDLLARLGAGEVAAGLGLGALPVLGTALVQSGQWSAPAVAASVPAFFMTFNLLLLNELPDEKADRAGGRRNLVLVLGRRGAGLVYSLAGLATPIAIIASVLIDVLPTISLLAVLPSLLLLRPITWALGDTDEPVPIPALGANVAWNLATNTVIGISLIIARQVAA